MQLPHKLVLVTGASSGIGASTAQAFALRQAHVLLLARRREQLEQVAGNIRQAGGQASVFDVDLADTEATLHLCAHIQQSMGTPDVIVNNAGSGRWRFLEETEPSAAQQMMALPYFAAYTVTYAFMTHMLARRRGHIVNVTSPAAFTPWPGATAYTVARWAMRGFSEALRVDLRGTGVRCSLVTFGEVTSEYFENNPDSHERLPRIARLYPKLTPKECGRTIVRVVERDWQDVARPRVLALHLWLARFAPGMFRWSISQTGWQRTGT